MNQCSQCFSHKVHNNLPKVISMPKDPKHQKAIKYISLNICRSSVRSVTYFCSQKNVRKNFEKLKSMSTNVCY